MSMCVHEHAHPFVPVHPFVCMQRTDGIGVLLCHALPLRQGLSLNPELTIFQLYWEAGSQKSLCLCPPALVLQVSMAAPSFYVGAGELSLGPHGCAVHTLTH